MKGAAKEKTLNFVCQPNVTVGKSKIPITSDFSNSSYLFLLLPL